MRSGREGRKETFKLALRLADVQKLLEEGAVREPARRAAAALGHFHALPLSTEPRGPAGTDCRGKRVQTAQVPRGFLQHEFLGVTGS